jgi:hypothetical protein
MGIRAAALALAIAVQAAGALAQEQRPPLTGISAIRIANYNIPSTVITERQEVGAVVRELSQLRSKPWRRSDARLTCYATLVLLSGAKTVTLFRVGPDAVVERTQGKAQSTYSIEVGQSDLPSVHAALAAIPPPKGCN